MNNFAQPTEAAVPAMVSHVKDIPSGSDSSVVVASPLIYRAFQELSFKKGISVADIKTFLYQRHGLDLESDQSAIQSILNRYLYDGVILRAGDGQYKMAAPRRRKKRSKGGSRKKRSISKKRKSGGRKSKRSKKGGKKSKKVMSGNRRRSTKRKKAANPEDAA